MKSLAIYGSGGFGREVKWLASNMYETCDVDPVVCFVDDNTIAQGTQVHGAPVLSLEDATARYPDAEMVIAVGYTRTREQLAGKAAALGWTFATLIHPTALIGPNVTIGEGSIITAHNILTCDIVLGKHVILNLACTIGHDTAVEDYVTMAPGCHIAGNVHIGSHSFLAQGVTTGQGTLDKPLVIGQGNTIGLNAIITKSTDPRVITTMPDMQQWKKT